MKRYLITAWMILIWCLLLPITPFIKQSNCWYYSVKKRISQGGSIEAIASKYWSGYHFAWIDQDGVFHDYNVRYRLPDHSPWWKFILYSGREREFKRIKIG